MTGRHREFKDYLHNRTSPVEILRLIECGALEEPLFAVLSWPRKLKELYYDVEQAKWCGDFEDEEPWTQWSSVPFVNALQPHKGSLKSLSFTRHVPLYNEGLDCGPPAHLADFTSLTTLNIYHIFLTGDENEGEAWKRLPRNPEQLFVFYDDPDVYPFLETLPYSFLMDLPRRKAEHFPKLQRVTIKSLETLYDVDGEPLLSGPWVPPTSVRSEFERAQIKLSTILGDPDGPLPGFI